ncbi:hypothetical protein SAMN02745121_06465 [Nannocystis exedens]|uniref:Uncharacterized protein n=1 Tax=Nannocystis exedens TaxID=54 RepID=A0A1I2F6P4_9BACT|nr:hypothetical protein [Nannocystis exedens]PCC73073.1 hypothetical protein NAEX_06159 [Nannocystis exedens]SFF00649.1 hypothetical protein SAMN02745121_06465 [Nannocystis exedens]
MNRKSFTAILLGGALAGGCSKPNPLFLDTWDVVTDSGSVSQTSAVTAEPTTIEPPTTTTTDPPVTTTSSGSITGTSDALTTDEPLPTTETTGDSFLCEAADLDMEGCCLVDIVVEADTFFSDALDGVAEGCQLSPLPVEYEKLACQHVSFGKAPVVAVFKDDGMSGTAVSGTSMMALRFPTKNGQLVSQMHGPVATELIKSIELVVWAMYDPSVYKDLTFAVHALHPDLGWIEGDDGGATACVNGRASFACRECGATVGGECPASWGMAPQPIQNDAEPLGVVAAVSDGNTGLAPIDLEPLGAPTDWVPQLTGGGLVIVPNSTTYKGEPLPALVPWPGVSIEAREGLSDADPRLRARVCKP